MISGAKGFAFLSRNDNISRCRKRAARLLLENVVSVLYNTWWAFTLPGSWRCVQSTVYLISRIFHVVSLQFCMCLAIRNSLKQCIYTWLARHIGCWCSNVTMLSYIGKRGVRTVDKHSLYGGTHTASVIGKSPSLEFPRVLSIEQNGLCASPRQSHNVIADRATATL